MRPVSLLSCLQWGHGISAVEIGIHPTTKIKLHRSSMGPRHLSRGNNKQPMNAAADKAHLQWGHGISAVEIAYSMHNSSHWQIFNGATASQPWK